MTFDLVGADPSSKYGGYFKTNNAGWRYTCRILEGLNCDTRSLAGDNSGDYVPKIHATQFGKALSAALENNCIVEMPLIDKDYVGSVRCVPFIRGNLKPVLDFKIAQSSDNNFAVQPVFIKPIKKFLKPIDNKTRNWLRDVARFFLKAEDFFNGNEGVEIS